MMRKYARILSLLMALILTFSVAATMAACSDGGDDPQHPEENPNEKPNTPSTPSEGDSPNQTPVDDGKITYTVLVKDAEGNPVADVEVQVCEGTTCKTPRPTDEDGAVSWTFKPKGTDHVKVQINRVPEGFVCPPTDEYIAEFADGETEVTVTLAYSTAAE